MVANTIGEVAARVYQAAASGSDIEQAVHRLQASGTLIQAISANDARAASAALATLQAGQIVRVQVVKAGKVFAGAGSGPAIAPVRGPIPGTYRGERYEAYSFSGVAFPAGPLRISLLQRARRAIGG